MGTIKAGVVIYHKNIYDIYRFEWVQKCLNSIKQQTFQDFTVYEICYGATREQLWKDSIFFHAPMINHIYAMNFIIDQAAKDCDIIFNVNLDDFYPDNRFRVQYDIIKENYDLISNNYQIVMDKSLQKQKHHIYEKADGIDNYYQKSEFHKLNLKEEINKNHNIICHPSVCFTREFWGTNRPYNEYSLGYEDLEMWKKAINNNANIYIFADVLCYYRISCQQTGKIHSANFTKYILNEPKFTSQNNRPTDQPVQTGGGN